MKLSVRRTKLYVDVKGSEWRWEGDHLVRCPPLFLLHGGPGGHHSPLKKELDFLSRWFQLFYVDQRGCGFSDPCPATTLTIWENVEDIEALRALFGFDKISLLGSSYGGMVTASYASRYPKNLSLIFLLGTAGSGQFIAAAQEYLQEHGTAAQIHESRRLWIGSFRTQAQLKRYYEVLGPLYRRKPLPKPRRPAHPGLRFNVAALNIGFRDVLPKWNVLPRLRRVRVPAFIAVGKHDWICPVSQSRALAKALPLPTFRLYPNAAHAPSGDEPKAFQRDVAAFVKRWKTRL